jgi:hypothetical protein
MKNKNEICTYISVDNMIQYINYNIIPQVVYKNFTSIVGACEQYPERKFMRLDIPNIKDDVDVVEVDVETSLQSKENLLKHFSTTNSNKKLKDIFRKLDDGIVYVEHTDEKYTFVYPIMDFIKRGFSGMEDLGLCNY